MQSALEMDDIPSIIRNIAIIGRMGSWSLAKTARNCHIDSGSGSIAAWPCALAIRLNDSVAVKNVILASSRTCGRIMNGVLAMAMDKHVVQLKCAGSDLMHGIMPTKGSEKKHLEVIANDELKHVDTSIFSPLRPFHP